MKFATMEDEEEEATLERETSLPISQRQISLIFSVMVTEKWRFSICSCFYSQRVGMTLPELPFFFSF